MKPNIQLVAIFTHLVLQILKKHPNACLQFSVLAIFLFLSLSLSFTEILTESTTLSEFWGAKNHVESPCKPSKSVRQSVPHMTRSGIQTHLASKWT